jgi:hypothetical protein
MADSDPATKKDLADLESRLEANLEAKLEAKLDAKLDALADRLMEFTRNVETNLLTSFHGYGKGQALRMHSLEAGEATLKERLDVLEQRILNLEARRPH